MRVIPLALGLGLLTLALWHRTYLTRKHRRWRRTTGTVVGQGTAGGFGMNAPQGDHVVKFSTDEGQRVVGRPRFVVRLGLPVEGRVVPVWYDPGRPRRFVAHVHWLDGPGRFLLIPAVPLTVIGVIVLL